jgi:dephospho-CoA kinase
MVSSFEYAIALTGGIATGKSTASKIFQSLGLEVIDADSIAHKILNINYLHIASLFGDNLIVNNKVDRKALGAIVFDDKEKRQKLEAFLHPLIYDAIIAESLLLEKKEKYYLLDIPLFFETNRYPISKVCLIYIPQTLQVERLMQRDNSSKEEAFKRIDTQISIEDKIKISTYVIDNTKTLALLEERCRVLSKNWL